MEHQPLPQQQLAVEGTCSANDDSRQVATMVSPRFTPPAPAAMVAAQSPHGRALHAEGRLTPAGLREMEAARADGRWDAAYASPSRMTVPDDLAAYFKTHARARRFFEQLDSRNRYAILYRLQDARRPETRQRRLEKFIGMLEAGETLY